VYTIPYCVEGGNGLGIDISKTLVDRASRKAKELNLDCSFMQAEIDSPIFPTLVTRKFDVVLLSEVLEHVINPDTALRNINNALKNGGSFILSTPTPFGIAPSSPHYIVDALGGNKLVERHQIDTNKVEILRHYEISRFLYRHDGYYPRALRKYLRNFGFRCDKFYTIEFIRIVRKSLMPFKIVGVKTELWARRIPLLNMLGSTNIAICRKM